MPTEPGPGGFGGKLREARERKGITLRQIADATKISVRVLEALERNDISRLPGGIFSRAFVRSYAAEVGLEPEETIRDFIASFPHDSITAGHSRTDEVEDNEALESDRRIASTVMGLLAVSVPIALAVLYFLSAPASQTPLPQPAAEATAGSVGLAANEAASSRALEPARVAVPVAPVPEPTPPPVVGDRLVAELIVSGPCWVSAIVDGSRVVGREMKAGERQTLDARREIVLSVGDAGAIALTLNGAPARSLGRSGQVVTIQVNATNFKEYLAAP